MGLLPRDAEMEMSGFLQDSEESNLENLPKWWRRELS